MSEMKTMNDNTETTTETAVKSASVTSAPAPAKVKAKASAAKPAAKAKPVKKAKVAATKKSAPKPAKAKASRKPSSPRKGKTQMTNQTKKVQDTIETMTAASNDAFREGFEKSLKSVDDINSFSKDNMDAVMASATTAGKGIETLNTNAVAFAKKSMEDTVAATKSLTTAKSVQDVVEVQADFMKSAMDAYLAEINKATELYAGAVKTSLKPLNDRVAATVEMVQSQR